MADEQKGLDDHECCSHGDGRPCCADHPKEPERECPKCRHTLGPVDMTLCDSGGADDLCECKCSEPDDQRITTALEQLTELEKEMSSAYDGIRGTRWEGVNIMLWTRAWADRIRSIMNTLRGE